MIISALIAKIRSDTGHSRVYPILAKKTAALPYVVIETNGSFNERHFGTGTITTGVTFYDFEIFVYGKTPTDVYNEGLVIRNALENFTGPLNSTESPIVTYNVKDIDITGDSDGYEREQKLFYYSIFITVAY